MLVVAHKGLLHAEVVEELEGHPGVLGGDEVRRLQGLQGPGAEVPQVPDGGRHQVQCAAHSDLLRFHGLTAVYHAPARGTRGKTAGSP